MSPLPRTPRALALPALALAAVVGLSGCGGGGDATRDGVRDRIENVLDDRMEESAAEEAAGCVADEMFEDSSNWSKEERNAATRAVDGEEPDPDLVAKLTELMERCGALGGVGGGGAATGGSPTDGDDEGGGDDDEGGDETTTTEADAAGGDDDETTTTDG